MNTQIIAIANQKGGVGKTTTCANLGIGLAQAGKKVLLIDGDPQGSLTISLGHPQPDKLPFTLSDAMGRILMDELLRPGEGILHHPEGVDLMPADIQLSGMEVSLVNAMSRETILRQYLDTLKGQYSHILIDCQPSLGMLTVNALAAANRVIIPVQAEYLPAKGLEQLLQTVNKVKRQINPKLQIDGILLTMVDNRTNFAKEIAALLRETYGSKIKVFGTEIPHSVRAKEISAEGKSIFAHDPTVLRARGMSGKHTSNHCIYGYKKDPNDKDHWIIDEEAAEVVRRIYRMAIEGKGPYEIARILATEKVERPSYYLAQRGMGNHQSNYNAADPYTWRGGTVADILSKQEYMGHTVNFRTYKESYKDKRVKMTPKEDLVIFENTQEAIIDKETWERVQTLRKTIRRTDSIGKANPLTGLMFCADCGAKMYNHRGKAGNARDWAGRPNGKKRPDRDEYNCSRYDLGNQHYDKYCTTHLIRTTAAATRRSASRPTQTRKRAAWSLILRKGVSLSV